MNRKTIKTITPGILNPFSKKDSVVIENLMLRRSLLKAGACALVGTSGLLRPASAVAWTNECSTAANAAEGGSNASKEEMIRAYYSGFEKKQWSMVESLLADSFTFTSPFDDHIDKRAFKEGCWPTADRMVKVEVLCVMVHGDDGFAKYLITTKDGKSLRNTDYFRFAGEKVKDIECYFGGKLGYPGQQA